MSRPLLELADIITAAVHHFTETPPAWFTWMHLKVLVAIESCRTAAMGGHLDQCSACGHRAISYNSCRNRHCPKCQGQVRDRWLAARRAELLPTPYAHVVFTLPHQLASLALQNKEVIYGLLFRASAQTLIEIAADRATGAEDRVLSVSFTPGIRSCSTILMFIASWPPAVSIGFTRIGYALGARPSSCPKTFSVKSFEASSLQGSSWLMLPASCGSMVFSRASPGELFRSLIRQLFSLRWLVYSKPPFGGPERVLRYLGAYTHLAISIAVLLW